MIIRCDLLSPPLEKIIFSNNNILAIKSDFILICILFAFCAINVTTKTAPHLKACYVFFFVFFFVFLSVLIPKLRLDLVK